MRPLELNLSSRPYSNNTLVWLAYIGLLAAAMGFTYWNVSSFRHYRHELAELDRRQGNMEQEQGDLEDRHRKILRGIKDFDRVATGVLDRQVLDRKSVAGSQNPFTAGAGLLIGEIENRLVGSGAPDRHVGHVQRQAAIELKAACAELDYAARFSQQQSGLYSFLGVGTGFDDTGP